MAKDKASFVLYADYLDVFEGLKDVEAGRLIKHILRYVNDKNPETKDRIVALTFEPIKKQLKRDLKRWEKSIDKKSENGKMGNLKRWNVDLYDQVVSGIITLDEAQNIAERRKTSLGDKVRSQNIANVADTVNVTVNDNVTVTDNVINSEREKSPAKPVIVFSGDRHVEDIKASADGTRMYYRQLTGKFRFATMPQFWSLMDAFVGKFDGNHPHGNTRIQFNREWGWFVSDLKKLPDDSTLTINPALKRRAQT